MPGPPPKDPSQRRRRNAEVRTALVGGPVPARRFPGPRRGEDHRLLDWWDDFVSTPMVAVYEATDWRRVIDLVTLRRGWLALVDEGEHSKAATAYKEIRLNESLLGATTVDRQRLKWDVKRPEPAQAEEPEGSRHRLRVVDKGAAG